MCPSQQEPGSTSGSAVSPIFDSGGEMGRLCRETNWAATPLGPVETWPQSLQTAAALVLGSGFPMILVWGPERIQIYNDAYISLIGQKHPAALAMPTHACWPEIRHLQEPIFEEVFRGETVNLVEAHYPLNRNSKIEDLYFDATFVPVPLETGGIGGSVSTLLEATGRVAARALEAEREASEVALRESEARYRALADLSPEATLVRLGDHYVYANQAAARMLRARNPEEIVGRSPFEITEPEYHDLVRERIRQILENKGTNPAVHMQWRALDGSILDVESASAAITWQGKPAIQAVVHDISERRQADQERERMLRESQQLLAALESSADFIGLASPERRGIYVNQAGRRMTGLSDMEAVRRAHIPDFFFPEDIPFLEGTIFPALEQQGRWRGEIRFRHLQTGEAIPVLYDAFRVTAPATGALIGYGTVTRDLTERDRLLRDTEAARAEAEAANRAKSEFLAVTSHELRTPLNAIGGYVDVLEMGIHGPVTEGQRASLNRIARSGRHLLRLINEVLNLARIEAGHVEYEMEDVPAADLVAAVTPMIEPQLEQKSLTLPVGLSPDLRVRVDREKGQQILLNLLSNAVKFTPHGGHVAVDAVQVPNWGISSGFASRIPGSAFQPTSWRQSFSPLCRWMRPALVPPRDRVSGWPSAVIWHGAWAAISPPRARWAWEALSR